MAHGDYPRSEILSAITIVQPLQQGLYNVLCTMLCDDLQGRNADGGRDAGQEGIHAYLWLIYVAVWQKPIQHCKATILQLKIFLKVRAIYLYPLSLRTVPGIEKTVYMCWRGKN